MEEVARRGAASFRISAGTYWLIGGANGFAVTVRGPLPLSGNVGIDLLIVLRGLKAVSGTVEDEHHHPLSGVRVAGINEVVQPPLGAVSVLSARRLGSQYSTITDQWGKWKLDLPEGDVPLVFEARGRSPEFRIRPRGSTALDVSMAPGATLRVTTDRLDPNMIVTLGRQESNQQPGIPADKQPLIWARWVTTKTLSWKSLAPGNYVIYAKYPDPRAFMQKAVRVGIVTLAAGKNTAVHVELPRAYPLATNVGALFLRGISRTDLGEINEVFGCDAGKVYRPADYCAEDAIGGTVVFVRLDGLHGPFYGMTNDRFFFTSGDAFEPAAAPWVAAIRPRADVRLQLRFAERDLQRPRMATATLHDCGTGAGVSVPIAIDSANLARFTAPAACRGLVLDFRPFEPVTAGFLRPGDQFLGTFTLRAAGSADVHVVQGSNEAGVTGAIVRVISRQPSDGVTVDVAEAVTGSDGWAHIPGLPSYRDLRVVARSREGDISSAATLHVKPAERGVIDPLPIKEPSAVIADVKIDDSVLGRFPDARLVGLLIRPADPFRVAEARQRDLRDETGPVEFDRLDPGRWLVTAVTRIAGTHSFEDIGRVDLKPGETRHLDKTITPNVFDGIITSGGSGVAARVIIEDNDRRLYFTAGADGIFHAALPKGGTYRVGVARLNAQADVIPVGEVAFTDSARRVEIEIPEGATVVSRVLANNKPIPNVVIFLSGQDDSGMVDSMTTRARKTDANGEATFDNLGPGAWTFSAEDSETGSTAEKTVRISDDTNTRVDLNLVTAPAISGTVRDLGGSPLPMAHVDCVFVGPSGNAERHSTDSDGDGNFRIDLTSPAPQSAICSIVSPMGTVSAFRAAPDEPEDISIPAATGMLRIQGWEDENAPNRLWLVSPDGEAIDLTTVAAMTAAFGSALVIPALECGSWHLVRLQSAGEWLSLANGLGESLPAIAAATVGAGGSETVDLKNDSQLGNSN